MRTKWTFLLSLMAALCVAAGAAFAAPESPSAIVPTLGFEGPESPG